MPVKTRLEFALDSIALAERKKKVNQNMPARKFDSSRGYLRIDHVVLHDSDEDKTDAAAHAREMGVNELIQQFRNEYTVAIDTLPGNFETFLGLPVRSADRHWKASRLFFAVKNEVSQQRLRHLCKKIDNLLARKRTEPKSRSTAAFAEPHTYGRTVR